METARALERLAAEQGLTLRSTPVASRMRCCGWVGAVLAALLVGVALLGAVQGWRLVVIHSASMGERAPLGSLLLVAPEGSDAIEIGDIIVMSRDDGLAITHAVTSIEQSGTSLLATTKGEANQDADPIPYLLDDETLTVRLVIPHLGRVTSLIRTHWLGLLLVLAAVFVLADRDEDDLSDERHPASLTPLPSVV